MGGAMGAAARGARGVKLVEEDEDAAANDDDEEMLELSEARPAAQSR